MSITPLPSAPAVTDTTAEFNTKAFAWVAALGDFTTEANALADQVETDADTASTAATNAAESELAAVAAANYKGEWSDITGSLAIPASVSHNGSVWVLTENLANVTTDEPGVNSPSKWLLVSLPPQAGNAGKFLTTDGSIFSWATLELLKEIKTPTNVSPSNESSGILNTATLTGSSYLHAYGVTKAASQWQVSTVLDFSTTVINTGDVNGTDVTYTISAGVLNTSTVYYWRVRYKDVNGLYSEWSTATSFTTNSKFNPDTIGESWGGGYYAGRISYSGNTYAIIVSPKSSGQTTAYWDTDGSNVSSTNSRITGPSNSSSINDVGHPAAKFCEDLTINGYSDWYLPAIDELEVCYYNLKPTTGLNNTSFGANSYSVPARGSNYTSGNPAQTSVSAFQVGGTEFFSSEFWSSTQNSSSTGTAYALDFAYDCGKQNSRGKQWYQLSVRAIRRILIS